MEAVKGLKKQGITAKMVRDLVSGWRKDDVLILTRSFKTKKRPQGFGLTEKGKKLLKSLGSGGSTK